MHKNRDLPISKCFHNIPREWKIMPLAKVVSQITDGVHATPDYVDEGIPFLSVNNLSNDRLDFTGCKYISLKAHEELIKRCKPSKGDVLMGKVATLGVSAVVETDLEFSIFVQIALIRPNHLIDSYFLKYLTELPEFRHHINSMAAGTSMKYIGIGDIARLQIPVPPILEQQEIAGVLATWDKAIALTERAIEAKQKRKMALMQKLLTGKLRFQQFAMEDTWLSGHFVDIAEIVMGQSPDGSTYNQQSIGVPLLNGPTEFGERYPTKIQWTTSPTKFCRKGDILLCVRGSSTGRTNIADSEYCIGRGIAAIRAKSGKSITSYLEQNLIFGIQKLLSLTSGSTFPNIDKKSIGQIPIVIPSVEEQKLIATVLLLADEEIQKLQQQVKQFQKQKQGLMQKLLTGEWRVAVQEAA